jgi:Protein of unknown function (DUF3485)
MSVFYETQTETLETPSHSVSHHRTSPGLPWVWMTMACVLLGGSVLARTWQDQRFADRQRWSTTPPFPLKDLPTALEGWKFQEGGETHLDPHIARVAGASDHIVRSYFDDQTGVVLNVLVLYGRAEALCAHTPEACYPPAGYHPSGDTFEFGINDEATPALGTPAVFRSVVYVKGGGLRPDRQEICYAFRYGSQWIPDAASRWKLFRHDPAMFRIQIERPVAEMERRDLNKYNPTRQFLEVFLPEFEKQLAASRSKGTASAPRPDGPATSGGG